MGKCLATLGPRIWGRLHATESDNSFAPDKVNTDEKDKQTGTMLAFSTQSICGAARCDPAPPASGPLQEVFNQFSACSSSANGKCLISAAVKCLAKASATVAR